MKRQAVIALLSGVALALVFGWGVFPHLLYARAEQPLVFSHQTHTGEGAGLACEDCHALLPDGRFSGIPGIAKCAECHSEAIGETPAERRLVDDFVTPAREIPWLVYSRQPDNVFFPHAPHLKRGAMKCESCHGAHGSSSRLRHHETNRISGYSRDIWGSSLLRWDGRGMKMSDCERCHAERHSVATACLDCHK